MIYLLVRELEAVVLGEDGTEGVSCNPATAVGVVALEGGAQIVRAVDLAHLLSHHRVKLIEADLARARMVGILDHLSDLLVGGLQTYGRKYIQ